MKKVVFFLIILAVLATGCKKKKSKELDYYDSNPIVMSVSGPTNEFDRQIQVSSNYDISYTALNGSTEVITVSREGMIHGKTVGTAQVKIDNSYESMVVDVIVKFFIEPTFEFGCPTSRIREIYGWPFESGNLPGDTILCYRYTANHGYSYTCGEMDFYFHNREYYEADLYIRSYPSPTYPDYLLNSYLNENFIHMRDRLDSIVSPYTGQDTAITTSYYKNKLDEHLICGKTPSLNEFHEWCLFYYRNDGANSLDKVLNRLPRSSKFRY